MTAPLSVPGDLTHLVGRIYEAALDAGRWPDFLDLFARTLRSQTGIIWAHDFSDRSVDVVGGFGTLAAHRGIDPAFVDTFARHYSQCNVWLDNPDAHRGGAVVNSSALYPDARLPATEWYGDWLRPQDLFYSCAAVVERQPLRSFNVTVVRARSVGPYTPEELQCVQSLMPHLRTAFALHRRLYEAQALAGASLAVLDGLPLGVVLMGERATVLHANSRARALAARSHLLHFGAGGTLQAASAVDDAALQRALRASARTGMGHPAGAGGALRLRGLDGKRLHILVAPLPRQNAPFGEHCAAAVFITDPGASIRPLADLLRGCYGLTPAEAQLAQSLVNGYTLAEHAERQGISVHTARSQFKSASLKVGTNRQADFVRTILTGPAMLRWADPT